MDEIQIKERFGDIFASPRGSILIHACNTKGVWGTGVALEFKKRYPTAYKIYHEFCNRPNYLKSKQIIVGTALLISPNDHDCPRLKYDGFHIACLFTSDGYGRNVDSPEAILYHTKRALEDLNYHIEEAREKENQYAGDQDGDANDYAKDPNFQSIEARRERKEVLRLGLRGKHLTRKKLVPVRECRAVRINSGKFGVPWERTKKVLEDGPLDIVVVRLREGSYEPAEGDNLNDDDDKDEDDDGKESQDEGSEAGQEGDEEEITVTDRNKRSLSKSSPKSKAQTTSRVLRKTPHGRKQGPLPKGLKRKIGEGSKDAVDQSPASAPKAKQRKK